MRDEKVKILIVDDQPVNIKIAASALSEEYDVRVTNSGLKALQILEKETFDLILLDIVMPEMDGLEVCQRLKNNTDTKYIPVIFLTSQANPVDEEWGLKMGAVDYIYKPFNLYVMQARVRNHIALKRHADLLQELASIDPLTHLANRRLMDKTLENEWKRAQRETIPLSLLLCDIDFFKSYNDNYGHGEGDICLQRVAKAIQSTFTRASDLVARFGGEEFVVILPNTNESQAFESAQKLHSAVLNQKIPHLYSTISSVVTVSVGHVTCVAKIHNNDFNRLITFADENLYKAKELGRNQVFPLKT
jgi:diguanylate cyclase (GGDEF)-like protein